MKGSICRIKLAIFLAWGFALTSYTQPAGYYSTADGKTGIALQQALHDIIDNHTVLSYNDLWTAFENTDKKSNGTVWDMYSDIPGGSPAYVYQFITGQCGNYDSEGDCFNREHSFPKSWFGGDVPPMYTDLFHLYPTDGYVNNKRDNYPFGETNSATWTSTNGSRLGSSSYPGYTGVVFEPVGGYKGDFARTYFYMAVRYYKEDTGWPGSDMVTGSQPREWALKMLMEWHKNDPVSQKERDRNEAVYALQSNRNPFIDNPLYADQIWGSQTGTDDLLKNCTSLLVYPNPSKSEVNISLSGFQEVVHELTITDISGRIVYKNACQELPVKIMLNEFSPGIYFITAEAGGRILKGRIIVSGY